MLTVLALVLTASLGWLFPPSTEEAFKADITRQRLDDIKTAIHAFRVNYNRLPCPATPDVDDNDALLGEEDCSTKASGVNEGILPVRALGISPEYLVDGWGRRFSYQVATTLCNFNSGGNSSLTLPLDCTSIIYNSTANNGDLRVRTTNIGNPGPDPAANGVDLGTNFAYIVISHGPNGFGGWMPSGAQRTSGSASDKEEYNADLNAPSGDNATSFWSDPYSSEFDDLVIFETKDQIEAATTDYDRMAMTLANCQTNVTNVIGSIDLTEYTQMNNGLIAPGDGLFGSSQNSGDAILSILWHAQMICAEYYPYYYVSDQLIKCPGFDRAAAGLGRTYNSTGTEDYCECPGANPNWNSTTGVCGP